jgi:serine/threonine protein kinase
LDRHKFSKYSDVWSYGVTVWEIFTSCSKIPYSQFRFMQDVITFVTEGDKLTKPDECPMDIWEIVIKCFDLRPTNRPSFQNICEMMNMNPIYVVSTKSEKN